jgi:hypothetical protein
MAGVTREQALHSIGQIRCAVELDKLTEIMPEMFDDVERFLEQEQAPAAPVEGKVLYEGPVTVGEEHHGGAFVRVNIQQAWNALVQTRRAHVRVTEIEDAAHD